MVIEGITLISILSLLNLILASANVIIAFSLLVYILTQNYHSAVARAFCALMTFVLIVFAVDVITPNVVSTEDMIRWMRLQWLGIAFVPAACLHFSDTMLQTTNSISTVRRALVVLGYLASGAFFALAAGSDLIVHDGVRMGYIDHLAPGPLFNLFTFYFFTCVLIGVVNIFRARQRCLTSTSRRRMGRLTVAIAAPGLGVFPYLLVATLAGRVPTQIVLALALLSNVGIALMNIVIAYTVAFQGVFTPDRVIKHNLIHYLLRGPLVASAVILAVLVIPRVERILGLPRDTVLIFTVAIGIVLFQVFINVAKPYIDRLIYRKDRDEITWIQQLDTRLLTSSDLEQILENVLIALCDLLRAPSGFVLAIDDDGPRMRVFCGPQRIANAFIEKSDVRALLAEFNAQPREEGTSPVAEILIRDGYWLLPLRTENGQATLGILGVRRRGAPDLSDEQMEIVAGLVGQAELALYDIQLQREVFDALQHIVPEIDQLQRLRSLPPYLSPVPVGRGGGSVISDPEFQKIVKDALSHYWGGPRLTTSPLLQLRTVQEAMEKSGGVPSRALRAVLKEAIERLKPDGPRSMTAAEWVLYNILEMKYIQGRRIREIADRMAISEPDFYRKQRAAIEELAKTLAAMELERTGQASAS
ncbi:MAG: hypothetical protein H5T64_10300 [Chloroflexi bacterium]|nr:hypothetical protein [Chloroflexota bacterium]